MIEDEEKLDDNTVSDCGHYAGDEHTCPFREEMNDDTTTLCNCCPSCTHECAMGI